MGRRGTLDLLALLASPSQNRASRVYDFISTRYAMGEESLYLNLGYWDGQTTYDAACTRLAEVLGVAAGLKAGDELIDCGFGFADQDIYWFERFGLKRITGFNITSSQVAEARRRVAARGLADRIDLREGSATHMPVADASCDKVTALETAFHYDTREDFFSEAFRVLRPGGRLATTDILPLPGSKQRLLNLGPLGSIGVRIARQFWQIPAANIYDRDEYARKLSAAGFSGVRIESIRERVFPGMRDFTHARLRMPVMRGHLHPLLRLGWELSLSAMAGPHGPDYILASAEKR